MSPDFVLLLLRVLLAVLLYVFLGTIVWLLWRDVRAALHEAAVREQPQGRLVNLTDASVYPLLPVSSLGRAPTNTIAIDDDTASLEHALITQRDGHWWLEDLGSRNGTILNGTPITEPAIISPGDVIGIGQVQFKLEAETAANRSPS